MKLKQAPLEPTDLRFPINLATALRLSDARPLMVAAAQASVWVAEAQLTRAKVLWVPQLNMGFDYIRHDGGGPDFNKGIMTAPSVNYFYGGAGLWQIQALTDVVFEPLAARQVLNSRQADIQSAKNDSLFMTADAYFRVHQYRGMYAGALYAVELGHDLVDRIARLSKDLVPRVEVDRARNMLADLEQQATSARDVACAQRQPDPGSPARPPRGRRAARARSPPDHLDRPGPAARRPDSGRPDQPPRARLVPGARPGSGSADPPGEGRILLPSILLNGFQTPGEFLQAGIFGLGPNSSLNQWTGRDDVSVQFLWQLDALGIGNLARIKEQRGEQSRAIIELFKTQDMVAADVTRAQARLQSATARVSQADRSLRAVPHRLQRELRGPAANYPFWRRPGRGLPAAGSGLRAPAFEDRPSTSTSPRSPTTTGRSSSCSTRWATPPAKSQASIPPATSSRWTRRGPPTCRRWAMVRPPQPARASQLGLCTSDLRHL